MTWRRERAFIASGLACAAALVLLAVALERALRVPHEPRVGRSDALVPVPSGIVQASLPDGVLEETVEHDPFHPERRRPGVAFTIPGAPDATKSIVAVATPVAALRLLGTVVSPGQDAFAMAQLGIEPPRVVRIGEKVGGFTLRKIEPGRAVFLSPDGETMDLRVSKSGP